MPRQCTIDSVEIDRVQLLGPDGASKVLVNYALGTDDTDMPTITKTRDITEHLTPTQLRQVGALIRRVKRVLVQLELNE